MPAGTAPGPHPPARRRFDRLARKTLFAVEYLHRQAAHSPQAMRCGRSLLPSESSSATMSANRRERGDRAADRRFPFACRRRSRARRCSAQRLRIARGVECLRARARSAATPSRSPCDALAIVRAGRKRVGRVAHRQRHVRALCQRRRGAEPRSCSLHDASVSRRSGAGDQRSAESERVTAARRSPFVRREPKKLASASAAIVKPAVGGHLLDLGEVVVVGARKMPHV